MARYASPALPRELYLLRDDLAYLNNGAYGACPKPVFEKYQWWQREVESQPVELLFRRIGGLMAEARRCLAEYIHAAPDDLVYVPNVTTGINIVARSIKLEPGDEILTTDHEYGGIERIWRFHCRRSGAILRHQPVPVPVTTAEDFVEQVWAGVTERTRVLYLSHVTAPTALIFPLAELCRRARARGVISVIDGAHAVGQIPLDMEEIGADFYTANLYKWLSCPKGSAFLHARRESQALLEPLLVSWGYDAEVAGPSRFIDEQEWTGTRDIPAYLACPEAIHFYREHDWDQVREQCHELLRTVRVRLGELTGLQPLSPNSAEWYSQMAAFTLPPCDFHALKNRLYDEYRVEVPIAMWHDTPLLRVSIQAYNGEEDVARMLQALAELLPQVRTDR